MFSDNMASKPHPRLMRLILFSTFVVLACRSSFAKTATLYYGIANETNSPFVEVETRNGRTEVKDGILKNLAEAITKEMGVTPSMVLLPQQRVGPDLDAGEISMVCFVHESWFPKELGSKLLWSDELTSNTNYIATMNSKPVSKIEDLYGKQVGTIVNFYYKKLDPFFDKGTITKEPGPSTGSNIEKLIRGRIDYMIISNLEYDYYKKKYPHLRSYDLGLDTVKVKCVLSKKASVTLDQLNKAIANLKKSGRLDKIFKP